MSLTQKLNALVAGIDDPKVKFDVMGTVNFLAELYSAGKINLDDLMRDLLDICRTIVEITNVDLTRDELEARARLLAEDLAIEIKLQGIRKRAIHSKLDMIFR
jgi:hypothetical protein